MTPEERDLIAGLFERMRGMGAIDKDREAEDLIARSVRQVPDAAYMLVQSVLVQEHALQEAGGRIEELEDRVRDFSPPRRLFDRVFEAPMSERLERFTLRRVDVLSISSYTRDALREIEPQARLAGVLPPPIDTSLFKPAKRPANAPLKIGFVGRVEDPRKNIELLVDATAELRRRGVTVETHVFGGEAPPATD